jgi:hypothetical protein
MLSTGWEACPAPERRPVRKEEAMPSKKSSGGGKSSSGKYRSAKSGRYVTKKYGQSHKSTTVKESK